MGKGLKETGKKHVQFSQPHRLDRELYFQNCGTGHPLSAGTHLAVDCYCSRFSVGTVHHQQQQFIQLSNNVSLCYPQLAELF